MASSPPHTRYTVADSPDEFLAAQRLADAVLPAHRLRAVLDAGGTPRGAFALTDAALKAPPVGLTEKQVARIREAEKAPIPAKVLDRANQLGVTIITWRDPGYPSNLRPFSDSAALLFVRGELKPEDTRAIGIVGSRRATLYGRNQATRFTREFVTGGITVISGGAAGIDTAAHRAALTSGGRTVAVLGCGADIAYPAENRGLFDEIAAGRGAVVSEFSFGTKPEPWRFPTRNRIIAGMSLLTLVIEAPHDSGALITARFAGDYGRDIWAVPGPVDSDRNRGCHRLIQDGAGLADSPEDVLDAFNTILSRTLPLPLDDLPPTESIREPRPKASAASTPTIPRPVPASPAPASAAPAAPRPAPVALSPDEEKLLAQFGEMPRHVDEAITASGLATGQGLAAATFLEMKSLIRRHPGNLFSRIA